jgi:chromosome partitioning protein
MTATAVDRVPLTIAVATLKGGSGKSTLAAALAVRWHLQGLKACIVDADPQHSLVRLAQREQSLAGLPVHECGDSGEQLRESIARLRPQFDRVVVDTPGFRAATTLEALSLADLVLVPVKPSPLDVDVMLDTARALLGGSLGQPRRFVCVLAQTTRDSVIARHIRGELQEAGFPLLKTELGTRVAYPEAALFGATPSMTEPKGAAAAEIQALTQEVDAWLMGDH